MTHHQLGFQRSHSFQSNAYDDEDRSTAHRDLQLRNSEVEDDRENSDNSEEYRTDESDLGENSLNEIAGGFTRSDTGDTAVVLAEIVSYLNGIILHGNIEVVKSDDKQEINYRIPGAVISEEVEKTYIEVLPESNGICRTLK